MAEIMVEVKEVTKKFKENTALDHVSLSFEKGKIHGVIGRNGSGKTVLFKCICGFMVPNSGTILVQGKPVKPSAPQDMGIIIEEPGFINSMSGYKNLKLLAAVRKTISEEEIKEVLKKVGLDPDSKKGVGTYSLGMKHRLGIAQAIMEKPPLLLLDEPMNGLDKHGVVEIRKLLRELNEEGITIIMSSHYMEDIEELCDTVTEMDQGKIAEEMP